MWRGGVGWSGAGPVLVLQVNPHMEWGRRDVLSPPGHPTLDQLMRTRPPNHCPSLLQQALPHLDPVHAANGCTGRPNVQHVNGVVVTNEAGGVVGAVAVLPGLGQAT